MTKNLIAGLDIGTSWVRLVVCEQKNGDSTPQILALIKKPSRGLRRGYVVNPEEATETIREVLAEAERTTKIKIRKVILGVSGVSLESKISEGGILLSRPDSEVNETDISRAIEASEANLTDTNNKQILHKIPLSFKLDGEKVLGQPEGLRGTKLEVRTLFITCSSQHLKGAVKVVEDAGGIIDDMVAAPLAASLVVLTKVQKMAGCVLVNIGSQTTSIAVFEESLPLSLQVFSIGSTDITNDIALGFKIPLEEAEKIKKGEGEPLGTKKKLDEIIEARLSDIFEFIEMHLKKLGRNGLLPAGLVITGGGSSVPNIEELSKSYFKLPARTASSAIAMNSKSQIRDSSWSVAYGLCSYHTNEDSDGFFGNKIFMGARAGLWRWLKEFLP